MLKPKNNPMREWEVYRVCGEFFEYITSVYFQSSMTAQHVKESLINHDGYPSNTVVRLYNNERVI